MLGLKACATTAQLQVFKFISKLYVYFIEFVDSFIHVYNVFYLSLPPLISPTVALSPPHWPPIHSFFVLFLSSLTFNQNHPHASPDEILGPLRVSLHTAVLYGNGSLCLPPAMRAGLELAHSLLIPQRLVHCSLYERCADPTHQLLRWVGF